MRLFEIHSTSSDRRGDWRLYERVSARRIEAGQYIQARS